MEELFDKYYLSRDEMPSAAMPTDLYKRICEMAGHKWGRAAAFTFKGQPIMIVTTPNCGKSTNIFELMLKDRDKRDYVITLPPNFGRSPKPRLEQLTMNYIYDQLNADFTNFSSQQHNKKHNKHWKREKPLSHFEMLAQRRKLYK